jgi:hypothetical protein
MNIKKLVKKAKTQRQIKAIDSILFTANQFTNLTKKNLSLPIKSFIL